MLEHLGKVLQILIYEESTSYDVSLHSGKWRSKLIRILSTFFLQFHIPSF